MTEAATLPTDVGTALSLQQLVYTWQDEPLTPAKAQSLDLLVVRAVQMASVLQSIWLSCAREGSVWESGYYAHQVRSVEFLAITVVDVLNRTEEIIARTRAKHPAWAASPVAADVQPSLNAAQEVLTKARSLVAWLNRTRPPVNEDMIRRSQESLRRNEGEDLSAIIARLNNGGPLVKE